MYQSLVETIKEKNNNKEEVIHNSLEELNIHTAPIQIGQETPLYHIHLLFVTLRLFHCFVTHNGRLVGVVSRRALKKIIERSDARMTIMRE